MSKRMVSKVLDVRQACCYDTLTTPIKEAMLGMKPGEVLEVIVSPSFKREFKFVEEEGHEFLKETAQENEIRSGIRLESREREGERKKENCMLCGGPLEYLTEALI